VRVSFRRYDIGRVLQWMTRPDEAYGTNRAQREAMRDALLIRALEEAILRPQAGPRRPVGRREVGRNRRRP